MPDISFHYSEVGGVSLLNNGNNLEMTGDFGFVRYKGLVYNSMSIALVAPSEHSFGPRNTRYALEM